MSLAKKILNRYKFKVGQKVKVFDNYIWAASWDGSNTDAFEEGIILSRKRGTSDRSSTCNGIKTEIIIPINLYNVENRTDERIFNDCEEDGLR